MSFYLPPAFRRDGVVAGFVLRQAYTTVKRTVTQNGVGPDGEPVTYDVEVEETVLSLAPVISPGVLFAQGVMYRPGVSPTLPAMPANARKNLYYNHTGGFYWGDAAGDAEDAFVGWARSDGSGVVAVSSRTVGSGPDQTLPVAGGAVLPGEETGVAGPLRLTFSGSQAQQGVEYAGSLMATGGTQPYTFAITVGALPTGLALDAATGRISGTPTVAGAVTFTAKVTDAVGGTQTLACTITVTLPSGTSPVGTFAYRGAPVDDVNARWSDPAQHAVVNVPYTAGALGVYTVWVGKKGTALPFRGQWTLAAGDGTIAVGARNSGSFVYPPTVADETWQAKVAVGAYGPADPIPATAVTSLDFTLHTPGVYGNTGSSTIGAPSVDYPRQGAAGSCGYIVTFPVDLPLADKDYFFFRISRVVGSGTGASFVPMAGAINTPTQAPIGVSIGDWTRPTLYDQTQDHADDWRMVDAAINPTGTTRIQVTYAQPAVPADGNLTLRLYGWLATRKDDGSGGTKTQQHTWPGGAQYFDVVLDPTKAQTDARVIDAATLGSGFRKNPTTLKPEVAYGSGLRDDGTGKVALAYGAALADDGTGKATVVIAGPLYKDVSGALNLKTTSDFVVDANGQLSQDKVNLAKAYGFDTSQFNGGSGTALAVKAIGVNLLVAQTALFTATATFAYTSSGPYVQVGAAGAVFGDNYSAPTTTLTVTSSGMTVQKGTNSVQVTAAGIGIYGPSGSVTATSGGVAITNGTSSVAVTASSVTLTNAAITCPTSGGGSVAINGTQTGVWITTVSAGSIGLYMTGGGVEGWMTPNTVKVGGSSLSDQLTVNGHTCINSAGQWIGAAIGGGPTTWSGNAQGTYSLGSTYQNTTGKPLYVSITFYSSTSASNYLEALAGTQLPLQGSPGYGTPVAAQTVKAALELASIFFMVMPNHFYMVFSGNPATIVSWVQWN